MPTIHTYDAPTQRLHPEEKGYAALETEGRRIGPLFNQAASDYEKIGRVTAETIRQRSWPYNILDLQNSRGGGGVRIKDTRPSASRAAFGGRSGDDGYGDFNQVTNGMGAFGDGWAKAQADADKQNAQQLRDRNAAIDYNNKVWDNTQKNWADRMKAEAEDDAATRKAFTADYNDRVSREGQLAAELYREQSDPLGGGNYVPSGDPKVPGTGTMPSYSYDPGNAGFSRTSAPTGTSWGNTFGAIGDWMVNTIGGGAVNDIGGGVVNGYNTINNAADSLGTAVSDYFSGTSQ